jgi:hypothetical protein
MLIGKFEMWMMPPFLFSNVVEYFDLPGLVYQYSSSYILG